MARKTEKSEGAGFSWADAGPLALATVLALQGIWQAGIAIAVTVLWFVFRDKLSADSK